MYKRQQIGINDKKKHCIVALAAVFLDVTQCSCVTSQKRLRGRLNIVRPALVASTFGAIVMLRERLCEEVYQ